MNIVQGDLLEMAFQGNFDVIIHGCNCFNTMGSGIARQIADRFPMAEKIDKLTVCGSVEKLGMYTTSICNDKHKKPFVIINAYTQYYGGSDVRYEAIRSVMIKIKKMFGECKIGYPKIGAGIAGGDWEIISNIINKVLRGSDHTLVEYTPPNISFSIRD
jgi:O-acetyl-ADP-ribose deacetylase (regulator of RNase III)